MFKLNSRFAPCGDQIEAIKKISSGINEKKKYQVLLGATGTGKTFTMANVIQNVNKPTLVLAPNKMLAGQLYTELKELFPDNRVEYFVSYYDYYQPEAYVPSSDSYIEKDSAINDEIDELRHSATSSLLNRDDVIVVASVSCIYGIGEVEEYRKKILSVNVGDNVSREKIIEKLINMMYERNDFDFKRGTFRAKGDVLEIIPVYQKKLGIRIDFFGDEVESITEFDPLTGDVKNKKMTISVFPASHFVTSEDKIKEALKRIESELEMQVDFFDEKKKYIEKQRIFERTNHDLEMIRETGFCSGVENYSRHMALRGEGETPTTLMDFFPDDYLLVIDESHITIPQVKAMYKGDRARKQNLVDYGFRLPSALDNRPLKFEEFEKKINQVVFVSATPADYEMEKVNGEVIDQIIRPTGLLDPTIEVKKSKGQIDSLLDEIKKNIDKGEKVLVTTLTIKMAEELTAYLNDKKIKVVYLHSKVKTLDRMKIVRDLRLGKYDVIVGINLLREGLDIPEVSLIAIMDADKQGFLRSTRSLIQTIGRCARNEHGRVIMYADEITLSMKEAIEETKRRREIQEKYNLENNINPKTIEKPISDSISNKFEVSLERVSEEDKKVLEENLEKEMIKAADEYDFERAAELRDLLFELKG